MDRSRSRSSGLRCRLSGNCPQRCLPTNFSQPKLETRPRSRSLPASTSTPLWASFTRTLSQALAQSAFSLHSDLHKVATRRGNLNGTAML